MTTVKQEPELLIDANRGIYIPQLFCKAYGKYITNMEEIKDSFADCLEGPDNEEYWDSWEWVLNTVKLTNDRGEKLIIGNLGDNGDLWAIPENYEFNND